LPTSVVYRTEGRRSASAKASNDGVNTVDEPAAIEEAGSADISDDYNEYAEVGTIAVGEYEVTLKGDAGAVSTAIWTSGGYSYAVMSDVPMGADAMTALVAQIA